MTSATHTGRRAVGGSQVRLRSGTTDRVMSRLFPKASPYLEDPNGWAESNGVWLWSGQKKIGQSLVENRYTAVRSCHGIGKSFEAALLVNWWLDVHKPGEAFVVTSAPTGRQVYAILWRYIRRQHRQWDLPGRITLDADYYMEISGEDELVGYGRKPADWDPAAFQGIHARYVLVVLDEAGGVPKSLYDATDSLVTSPGSRVLAIGNPDDKNSHFATLFRPGSAWNGIRISAYDAPAFTGERVPPVLREELVTREWVEERRRDWGEESPLFRSKVEAEFPEDAEDSVVPGSWAFRCKNAPDEDDSTEPNEGGLDCGAGGDESVMIHRLGSRAIPVFSDRNPDTMSTADKAHMYAVQLGMTRVKVDSIGIGKGIADRMRRLGSGKYEVIEVNVGQRSTDPKRFPKLRDQIWWEVGRQLSQDGGWNLSEMPDDFLAQLTAPKYTIDASGRVKVEPKDETKKRIGRSPDHADAALLAFYSQTKPRWRLM